MISNTSGNYESARCFEERKKTSPRCNREDKGILGEEGKWFGPMLRAIEQQISTDVIIQSTNLKDPTKKKGPCQGHMLCSYYCTTIVNILGTALLIVSKRGPRYDEHLEKERNVGPTEHPIYTPFLFSLGFPLYGNPTRSCLCQISTLSVSS